MHILCFNYYIDNGIHNKTDFFKEFLIKKIIKLTSAFVCMFLMMAQITMNS